MAGLAKAYGRVLEACGLVSAVLVLAMTAMIVGDVILRIRFVVEVIQRLLRQIGIDNVARIDINSVELTEYMLFYAAAFAAPWLLRRGQHIRIDVVIARVPRLAGWTMELACDLIGLGLSLLLSFYGGWMLWNSMNAGTLVVKNLIFHEWLILWPLPLMFVLVSIEFIFRIQRLLTGPRTVRSEGGAV